MQIRAGQLNSMLLADDERFRAFLLKSVQEQCRDSIRDIDPLSLKEMIDYALRRARSHRLRSAKDQAIFVGLMFEIAPNFDQEPSIAAALRNLAPSLSEGVMDAVLERVPESSWDTAEQNRDSIAWFPELAESDTRP